MRPSLIGFVFKWAGRWKGRGVFTHRPSIPAADAARRRNRSVHNLTRSLEWTSRRGSVAFSLVGLHPAGLRSPPVSPLCVWPSSPQPAARWNSLSPGGRLWRDWGHTSLGEWNCRQTELSLYTNTGEFASYIKLHIHELFRHLMLTTNGSWQAADCGEPGGPGCNRWEQTDPHACHWSWFSCKWISDNI